MAQTQLTADSLGDLDEGRARGIINAVLAKIYADLEDRGQDEMPRNMDLRLTFTQKGGLLTVETQVSAKLPAYRSNKTVSKLHQVARRDGELRLALLFQEHDAENPEQGTFPELD